MRLGLRVEKVTEQIRLQYAARIEEEYGELGVERLIELAGALDLINKNLAVEIRTGVTVCVALDSSERLLDPAAEYAISDLATAVGACATIQVLPTGRALVAAATVDPKTLAKAAVVYHFDGQDNFVFGGAVEPVLNVSNFPSIFGTPLFLDLGDALDFYATHRALKSQCPILSRDVWHDPGRVVLVNSPEEVMQRSLQEYLLNTLRSVDGIEPRREQYLDETWRTDIKITWLMYKRVSYIEIKWMGLSVNRGGNGISSFRPGASDAVKGASQLANYLDQSRSVIPTVDHYGYLAVFDARRDGVDSLDFANLSPSQGLHFRNRDVVYEPDLASERYDFGPPKRFFMEPCAQAASKPKPDRPRSGRKSNP